MTVAKFKLLLLIPKQKEKKIIGNLRITDVYLIVERFITASLLFIVSFAQTFHINT